MDILSTTRWGLYNYYCLATDVSKKLSTFKFYHYYSMVKTIAHKKKSSAKKVIKKYGIGVPRKVGADTFRVVGIRYTIKEGTKTMAILKKSISLKVRYPMNLDKSFPAASL